MTWYEYSILLGGHIKKGIKKWEHTRFVAYWTYWANSDTDRDSLLDFLPLITDPPAPEPEIFSEEDRLKVVNEAAMRAQLFKDLHK
jgi:hypothetical protein